MKNLLPVLTVLGVILAIWYVGAVRMNMAWTLQQAERAGVELSLSERIADTMRQERAVLPAPHQVAVELWKTTVQQRVTSKRSLVFHGWVTLNATLWV